MSESLDFDTGLFRAIIMMTMMLNDDSSYNDDFWCIVQMAMLSPSCVRGRLQRKEMRQTLSVFVFGEVVQVFLHQPHLSPCEKDCGCATYDR